MVCLYCGSTLEVFNTRAQKRLNQVWRRRRCTECGALFTTHEAMDLADGLMVRTKDDTLGPFWRDKLFVSIYYSCQHRKVPLVDAHALTATVMGMVGLQSEKGVVDASRITEITSTVLHRFDSAAAVHYDAFHPSHTASEH